MFTNKFNKKGCNKMVDIRILKSEIVKHGLTQGEFCKKIKMSESTFSRRLKNGFFRTDEADRIINALDIKNPEKIFFARY